LERLMEIDFAKSILHFKYHTTQIVVYYVIFDSGCTWIALDTERIKIVDFCPHSFTTLRMTEQNARMYFDVQKAAGWNPFTCIKLPVEIQRIEDKIKKIGDAQKSLSKEKGIKKEKIPPLKRFTLWIGKNIFGN